MPRRRIIEEPKKVKKGTFKRLVGTIFCHPISLIFIALGLIGSTIASTSTNLYIKVLVDEHIAPLLLQDKNNVDFGPFVESICSFAIILIIGVLCSLMYHLLVAFLSNKVLRDMREKMYSKMQTLPLKYFDTNKAGDIMSKYTNDLDTFRQVISQALPATFSGIFQLVVTFVTLISLSVNLFIVVLIVCFLMFLFTKWSSKKSLDAYKATQKNIAGINSYVEEMVDGAKEVKVYCYEERNIKAFSEKNEKWAKAIVVADMYGHILMPILNSIGNIMYVIVVIFGGVMIIYKMPNISFAGISVMTIGTITSFMSFTKSFSFLISELSTQVPFILQSLSGAERIFELLDEEKEIDEGNVTLVNVEKNKWAWHTNDGNVPVVGNIVLKDVNFSYVQGKQVLKNINVYADKGQKIALVGSTGAGKTTITNLINRFYEIDSGEITYDGVNIKDIKKEDLRYAISIVLQEVNLFSGTILENIRYGNTEATDEECIAAAKLVYADKFIERLPDSYNTYIKGSSGRLSQGQKQLISIARAAVANPSCLILDEATSSIDTRTEKLIQKGLQKLMEGRSVFVIAHRLSTVRDADVIMVMEKGEIIERGTHEELLAKKGRYYELYTGVVEMD